MAPGKEIARVHVKVRAAPWIDVRTVSLLVRGKEVERWSLLEHPPTSAGGAAERAREQRDVVRLEHVVRVPVPEGGGSVVVVARGERLLSDVLPFFDGAPYGFTNPVRLIR